MVTQMGGKEQRGREIQEGRDTGTQTADSPRCTAETYTAL